MGSAVLSRPQKYTVGYPSVFNPSTSLRVPSNSANTMLGLPLRASAAATKWGAIVLQCVHQGAQILTKYSLSSPLMTSLQFFPTKVRTAAPLSSGMGADLRKGFNSPDVALVRKSWMFSALNQAISATYFCLPSTRQTKKGPSMLGNPKQSPNLEKWSALAPFSMRVQTSLSWELEASSSKVDCACCPSASDSTKRMSAFLFSLKMALTAFSPKGTNSDVARIVIRATSKSLDMVFIFKLRILFQLVE